MGLTDSDADPRVQGTLPADGQHNNMPNTDNNQRNWNSFRIVMEGLILAGIIYLIQGNTQQGKDMVAIKTSTEYMAKNVDKIPNLEIRVNSLEEGKDRHEKRITDLEILERAK